jgi:heptosyltransferase-2
MATPCLRAVRRHVGSRARITGILRPYVAEVLAGSPWLDEQILLPQRIRGARAAWHCWQSLRNARFDVALLLTNSWRTAALAWLSGARERVGYARSFRRMFLTGRLPRPHRDGRPLRFFPTVNYYLELAYALGCPVESSRLELATTEADEQAADRVWQQFGLRQGRVVAINSSGAYGAAKLWPAEHTAALARRIATELDGDVLLLCGPSEQETARRIAALAGHPRVVSLAEEPLGIGLSKACVRRSRVLVTTDSGPRHFAVAFGVPLVTLCGPTPPIWGENPTAREVALAADLPCLGCHRRTCPLGHHRCMQNLSVAHVFQGVQRQWEAAPLRKAA